MTDGSFGCDTGESELVGLSSDGTSDVSTVRSTNQHSLLSQREEILPMNVTISERSFSTSRNRCVASRVSISDEIVSETAI